MTNSNFRSNPSSIKADKNNWMNTILLQLQFATTATTVNQLCKLVGKNSTEVTIALGYFAQIKIVEKKGKGYKLAPEVTPEDLKIHGFLVQK